MNKKLFFLITAIYASHAVIASQQANRYNLQDSINRAQVDLQKSIENVDFTTFKRAADFLTQQKATENYLQNWRDQNQQTLLHKITSQQNPTTLDQAKYDSNKYSIIEELLKNHVDPNKQDSKQKTALFYATIIPYNHIQRYDNQEDRVKTKQINEQNSILKINIQNKQIDIFKYIDLKKINHDIIRLFLEYKTNPNIQDYNGNTVLHNITIMYNYLVSQYLDNLHFAQRYVENDRTYEKLLEDMRSYNDAFRSALDYLVAAGADTNIKNKLGNTALYKLISTYPITEENRDRLLFNATKIYHDELYQIIDTFLAQSQSKQIHIEASNNDNYEMIATPINHAALNNDSNKLLSAAIHKKYCNLNIINKLIAANHNNTMQADENHDNNMLLHKIITTYNDRFKDLMEGVHYYEHVKNSYDRAFYAIHKRYPSHEDFIRNTECGDYTNLYDEIQQYNDTFCAIIDNVSSNSCCITIKNNHGNTPLQHLIDTYALKFSIKKNEETLTSNIGHAYLDTFHKACDRLLPLSDITTVNNSKNTLLHSAIYHLQADIDLIQKLLTSGVNVNAKNNDGNTCLHYVMKNRASKNTSAITDLLINAGASFNEQNNEGWTPMHCVMDHINFQQPEFIDKLIAGGANVNIQNNDGNSPGHLLIREPNSCSIYAKKLFDFNPPVDLELHNKLQKTVMYYAVELKNLNFIEHALQCLNNNPNMFKNEKKSLMHAATSAPYCESETQNIIKIITLLHQYKVNINAIETFTDPRDMIPDQKRLQLSDNQGTPLRKMVLYQNLGLLNEKEQKIIKELIPVIIKFKGHE